MSQGSIAAAVILLWLFSCRIKGDIPPHCLHEDVVGTWKIHLGVWRPCPSDPKLHDPLCGFSLPDRPQQHGKLGARVCRVKRWFSETTGVIPPDLSSSYHETESFEVCFTDMHVSRSSDGISSTRSGRWTIVYDEGLDWRLPDDKSFFAYFKYLRSPEDPHKIRSFCTATMLGWWRTEQGDRFGCWWGEKLKHANGTVVDPTQWTNEIPETRPTLIEISKHYFKRPADNNTDLQLLVSQLSESPVEGSVRWKPISKAQSFTLRGQNVTSIRDLYYLLGQPRRYDVVDRHHRSNDLAPKRFFLPGSQLLLTNTLGQEMDWTNPSHVYAKIGVSKSLVPAPKRQVQCGSCYAIVIAQMLTSRLWKRYPNDSKRGAVHLSSLPLVQCSPYSQGCHGGYIYLALKHVAENGLFTEDCVSDVAALYSMAGGKQVSSKMRHLSQCAAFGNWINPKVLQCREPMMDNVVLKALRDDEQPQSCSLQAKLESNWGYVGGAFGRGKEELIREALGERGPIAASIQPTPSFGVYRTGIFHTPIELEPEFRSPSDQGFPWEKLDHAVLIVGMGLDIDPYTGHTIPFWKVQNSWGQRWGESGYVRILRGTNEMGIELVAVEGTPYLSSF